MTDYSFLSKFRIRFSDAHDAVLLMSVSHGRDFSTRLLHTHTRMTPSTSRTCKCRRGICVSCVKHLKSPHTPPAHGVIYRIDVSKCTKSEMQQGCDALRRFSDRNLIPEIQQIWKPRPKSSNMSVFVLLSRSSHMVGMCSVARLLRLTSMVSDVAPGMRPLVVHQSQVGIARGGSPLLLDIVIGDHKSSEIVGFMPLMRTVIAGDHKKFEMIPAHISTTLAAGSSNMGPCMSMVWMPGKSAKADIEGSHSKGRAQFQNSATSRGSPLTSNSIHHLQHAVAEIIVSVLKIGKLFFPFIQPHHFHQRNSFIFMKVGHRDHFCIVPESAALEDVEVMQLIMMRSVGISQSSLHAALNVMPSLNAL